MSEIKKEFDENNNFKTHDRLNRPAFLDLTRENMDVDTKKQIEIIDLCTPQTVLVSKTMLERFSNLQHRLSILACYPKNKEQEQTVPLFPNVPPNQLHYNDLILRNQSHFSSTFDIKDRNTMIPSLLREKYQFYFNDLINRLKVDMTLLDYNYTRLNQFIQLLDYEIIRIFRLRSDEIERIDEKEYPLALEFFLQFDSELNSRKVLSHTLYMSCFGNLVHLFYMKTCSFRHARPRTLQEGLFCLREPESRYELAACGNCGLCYPNYDRKYRSKKSVLDFNQAHQHIFVNGYKSILNCSASCHTQNIIYALICPCGKYDYIGGTTQSLHDRLMRMRNLYFYRTSIELLFFRICLLEHREHGNRIIHEFLLGQDNVKRHLPSTGKTAEIVRKDRMRLYQHSARCPIAMQIFLDANPQYWRFTPMSLEEAQKPEQQLHPTYDMPNNEISWSIRSKHDCLECLESVPKPTRGYTFSKRQIALQTEYFHKMRDRNLPNLDIDLYDATIIAVLPETCTDAFRFMIESLFITYAETKLNTVGNVLTPQPLADSNPWLIRDNSWCAGLVRRPQPKTINTNTKNLS